MAVEVQCDVVDRVRLAHARSRMHEGAGDEKAHAVLDQVDQFLDSGGGDAVMPPDQRV